MGNGHLSAWFLLHYYNLNHLIRHLAEYVVQGLAPLSRISGIKTVFKTVFSPLQGRWSRSDQRGLPGKVL